MKVSVYPCLAMALLVLGLVLVSDAQDKPGADPQAELKALQREDLQALVQGNNEFAFDLYRRLAQKGGNIIVSPYSISSALAMTYAGPRGETAEQMAKVLHFTLPQDQLH